MPCSRRMKTSFRRRGWSCTVPAAALREVVMSGGSGDSGGDGGVRGDGDARGAAPQEPQTRGSPVARWPVLSPGSAARRRRGAAAAVGGGTEAGGVFWTVTGTRELWPSAAYCGCTVEGAGGGRKAELGVASGRRPDLRGPQSCHRAGPSAGGGCIRGT